VVQLNAKQRAAVVKMRFGGKSQAEIFRHLQQTAEITSKYDQSVLANSQNCGTIPGGVRQRTNCEFAEDNGCDY
jgi:hypothetical protein